MYHVPLSIITWLYVPLVKARTRSTAVRMAALIYAASSVIIDDVSIVVLVVDKMLNFNAFKMVASGQSYLDA